MYNAEVYGDDLKQLIDVELFEEEQRCHRMLEFDMRKRAGEPVTGERPWHAMACESAERLMRVRWEMESRGLEHTLFGCERGTAEEEDRVLVAA